MLNYLDLTITELAELEREKTILLMALSPVEAHGSHLPVGTDIFVAEELQRRYGEVLAQEYPQHKLVRLPPLFIGADAIPVKGSLNFSGLLLKRILLSLARELAGPGFKYLFLSDNHGGPRHLLAIETVARLAWKKYRFSMINPFGLLYRMMVEEDPRLLQETGLAPGCCGDDSDYHAGTNETSLMLASAYPETLKDFANISPSHAPPPKLGVMLLARLLGMFSGRLRGDLEHLARLLGCSAG